MQTLNKIIAVIFAFLFMIAAVAALFLFNLERRAFSVETYQQVFANQGFYERLPAVMAETLITSTSPQGGLPFILQGISMQDAEAFLRAILPAEALRSVGDEALHSVFAYVNQQTDSVQVSLVPLKANIASETSLQAVFGLLSGQPPCTVEQLMNMTALLLQQQIAFCNPPPELQPLITPILQLQLQALSTSLPDSVILMTASGQQGWDDPRERLRIIRGFMRFSPLIALGFFSIYLLMVVMGFKNWLDWLGIPFVAIGTFAGLMALLGGPMFRVLLQEILVRNLPAYVPVILLDYASQLAEAVTNLFLSPVIWEGLILAILGIVMLVLSVVLKQSRRLL